MALSVAKRKEIEQLLAEGHAVSQIAKHVGCCQTTVHRIKKGKTQTPLAAEVAEVRAIITQSPTVKEHELQVTASDWQAVIPSALDNGINYLREALADADNRSPRTIAAVTSSVAALAELQFTLKMFNQRFMVDRS